MQNSTTEDEKNDEIADEPDEEANTTNATTNVEVTLPETVPLDSTYSDAGFWKVSACEDSLDDLLADMEWACHDPWGTMPQQLRDGKSITVWPFACSLALRGELS